MLALPDYTSKVSFALLLSIFTLVSCSDNLKRNSEIIKALDEGLVNSNKMLAYSTEDVLISLRDKMSDPATVEKAKLWYPKAELIKLISTNAYNYIEKIKIEICQSKDDINIFFRRNEALIRDSLFNYKKRLLDIDAQAGQEFRKSIVVFTPSFDSVFKKEQNLSKAFFDNTTIEEAVALLSKFQNNIRYNENRMVTFCYESIATHFCGFGNMPRPIVGQSSTIVQPGQQIEIFSGVGSFDQRASPKVFVYGKSVPLNESSIAICKFNAEKKPGKYYVPVKINYTNQEGRQVETQIEVEYTVANIQKQE